MVHVAQDPNDTFAIWWKQAAEKRFAQLELPVLPAGLPQVPDEIDAVGDRGHQGECVACGPHLIVVLRDGGVGITAGVGRIVPRAVVVHGPIHKLQVAVGADAVDVEIVRQTHLADVELEASFGHQGSEGERCPDTFNQLVREADGLVKLGAGHVRHRAQGGVADHVQIGETGETERLADAPARGSFEIEQRVGFGPGIASQLRSKIERAEQGGLVLAASQEAVGAFVG